jgi:hypothetical protein
MSPVGKSKIIFVFFTTVFQNLCWLSVAYLLEMSAWIFLFYKIRKIKSLFRTLGFILTFQLFSLHDFYMHMPVFYPCTFLGSSERVSI